MAIPAALLQKLLRGGKAFGRKSLNLPDLERAATAGKRAAQFKPGAGARRDPSASPMWGGPPYENPLSTEVARRGTPPRTSMENFREARRRGLPDRAQSAGGRPSGPLDDVNALESELSGNQSDQLDTIRRMIEVLQAELGRNV